LIFYIIKRVIFYTKKPSKSKMPKTYAVPVNTYPCGKQMKANCDSKLHRRLHFKSCATCQAGKTRGVFFNRTPQDIYKTNDVKMEADINERTALMAGEACQAGRNHKKHLTMPSKQGAKYAKRLQGLSVFKDSDIKLTCLETGEVKFFH
jgi:hypothetical protein